MIDTTTTNTKPAKAFIVRVKKGQQAALEHGVVGIGWSKIEGMDKFSEEKDLGWAELKKRIGAAYSDYKDKGRSLGNVAGSIWRFCMEGKGEDSMSVGDYVLMPVGRGFHLGKVTSSVQASTREGALSQHMSWERKVQWLTKDKVIDRDAASRRLQNRLKIRQTCANVSKLLLDILEAEKNRKKEVFGTKAKNAVRNAISEIVKTYVGNDQLEELIGKLCKKSGASEVKVLSKKNSKEGDADVQANYPVFVGNNPYFVTVLYQAKNHSGETDSHGVQQLIDRIAALNPVKADVLDELDEDQNTLIYKGCLVTAAATVKDEAVELAKLHSIEILRLEDLVDWILDAGLSDLNV